MTAVHLILAGLGASILWLALITVSPTRTCTRCHGERVSRHRLTGQLGRCPRCRGTGRHYRRGATLAHRAGWALRRALADETSRRRARKTEDSQ